MKIFTPFRVGLLVIAAGVILFLFLSFVKKGGMKEEEALTVYALFKDASGLGKKSRVQIAGIGVGEIGEISLEGLRAKVQLKLKKDLGIRKNATLAKRSESLLGDYMLDLWPGDDKRLLENGDFITEVADPESLDALKKGISLISDDVKAITGSLRTVISSDAGVSSIESIVTNMVALTQNVDRTVADSSQQLEKILKNVEGVSRDIRGFTAGEQQNFKNIVENFEVISKDVRDVVVTVKKVIGENEGEVKGGLSSLKDTVAKLDRTLANVEEVTQKIKEGKGTVGALLTDERMGQKLAETIDDVNDFASRLTNLQTEVGLRTEYGINQGAAKTFFGIRLSPKPDKFYLLEAVDDPRGAVETVYLQQNPPANGQPTVQKQVITRESLKFNAQLGKRFGLFAVRIGIIESTGGLGFDLNVPIKFFYYSRMLEDALVLKVDAFNFSVETLRLPRLRATLRFMPIDHLFVTIGVDDVLNNPNRDSLTNRLVAGRDFFFGAGVFFTDDDLRSLLPVLPSP